MLKNIIFSCCIIGMVSLSAQSFLDGVHANEIIMDKIVGIDIDDTLGINNLNKFYYNSQNTAISPDNIYKAETRTQGRYGDGIWVVNLGNKKEGQIDERGVMPKWSPDGLLLSYLKRKIRENEFWKDHQLYGGHELWIYDRVKMNTKKITSDISIEEYLWNPKGGNIAINYRRMEKQVSSPSLLGIIDIKNNNLAVIDSGSPYNEINFTFSPNGKMLAYVNPIHWELDAEWFITDAEIFIADIDGNNKTQLTNTKEVEEMVKWSKDGKSLFIVEHSSTPCDLSVRPYVKILLKKK